MIAFFRDALGYAYLGNWKDREGNSNVEEDLLTDWLKRRGHSDKIIQKVLFELGKATALGGSKTLYDANREVYGLLRYGVKVRPEVGEQIVTVWLIDWAHAENNDFAVAEEMTVVGETRRIWLNLELAKKPVACLEYILVHEMVHFIERQHSDRFRELMDALMPSWRICRDELNQAPLAHEEWGTD